MNSLLFYFSVPLLAFITPIIGLSVLSEAPPGFNFFTELRGPTGGLLAIAFVSGWVSSYAFVTRYLTTKEILQLKQFYEVQIGLIKSSHDMQIKLIGERYNERIEMLEQEVARLTNQVSILQGG